MAWAGYALANDAGFGTFGVDVLYTPPSPPGGADVLTIGVFRQESVTVQLTDDSLAQSVEPRVDLRRAAISGGPLSGARVTVNGELFEIWAVEGPSDGEVCRCRLKRL